MDGQQSDRVFDLRGRPSRSAASGSATASRTHGGGMRARSSKLRCAGRPSTPTRPEARVRTSAPAAESTREQPAGAVRCRLFSNRATEMGGAIYVGARPRRRAVGEVRERHGHENSARRGGGLFTHTVPTRSATTRSRAILAARRRHLLAEHPPRAYNTTVAYNSGQDCSKRSSAAPTTTTPTRRAASSPRTTCPASTRSSPAHLPRRRPAQLGAAARSRGARCATTATRPPARAATKSASHARSARSATSAPTNSPDTRDTGTSRQRPALCLDAGPLNTPRPSRPHRGVLNGPTSQAENRGSSGTTAHPAPSSFRSSAILRSDEVIASSDLTCVRAGASAGTPRLEPPQTRSGPQRSSAASRLGLQAFSTGTTRRCTWSSRRLRSNEQRLVTFPERLDGDGAHRGGPPLAATLRGTHLGVEPAGDLGEAAAVRVLGLDARNEFGRNEALRPGRRGGLLEARGCRVRSASSARVPRQGSAVRPTGSRPSRSRDDAAVERGEAIRAPRRLARACTRVARPARRARTRRRWRGRRRGGVTVLRGGLRRCRRDGMLQRTAMVRRFASRMHLCLLVIQGGSCCTRDLATGRSSARTVSLTSPLRPGSQTSIIESGWRISRRVWSSGSVAFSRKPPSAVGAGVERAAERCRAAPACRRARARSRCRRWGAAAALSLRTVMARARSSSSTRMSSAAPGACFMAFVSASRMTW